MSIKTDSELIRDETGINRNTATRVGGVLVDMATGLELLQDNQYSGVIVYETLLELPATGVINTSYKVTNDDVLSSNNGYYHWTGSAYVKDADLANGIIISGNVDAVSGDTAFQRENSKDILSRYLKPNDLENNDAYLIYDEIANLDWGYQTNTTNPISKSTINLPTDFALPFNKAINLKTTAPLTTSTKFNFRWKTKFAQNLKISNWVELEYGLNKNAGLYIRYMKGLNDALIKKLDCQITMTNAQINTIISDIDTNGFWSSVKTDFTIYSYGYYIYEGRYFINYAVDVTATIGDSDFVSINFGHNSLYAIGDTKDLWFFGFQVYTDGFLDQTKGEPKSLGIGEQGVLDYKQNNAFADSYEYDNQIIDFFNGGRKVYDTDNYYSIRNANQFELVTGMTISASGTDEVFGDYYTLDYNTSSPFPKFSLTDDFFMRIKLDIYYVTTEETNNATFGFWLKRSELNGNSLMIEKSGAQFFLKPSDMLCKGFKETRFTNTAFEVADINGEYTYIKTTLWGTPSNEARYSLSNTGGDVTSLTFYNPTLIYNKTIDPYYNYKSLAEKNNSKLIGKKVLYIGDSQYNNQIMSTQLAKNYGCNIIDAHYGGHGMAIRGSQTGQANYNSFYHKNLRDVVLDYTDIDLYIFTTSTNDGGGGGELDTVSVQAVLDNYPAYGDDAPTVASKQALFDALTSGEVDTIFGYKNTYSAYLKQLQENRPDARIITCSVPISVSGQLTGALDVDGKGIWKEGYTPDSAYDSSNASRQQIRNDSKAIADKHNTNWVDLLNDVGLTYWNFTTYSVDGTHWDLQDSEIRYRIAWRMIEEIKKIF